MGSSKLMVTSLSCAELGTAQSQLVSYFVVDGGIYVAVGSFGW